MKKAAKEFKVGDIFIEKNNYFQILDSYLSKSARAQAIVHFKAKNIMTETILNFNYFSTVKLETAEIIHRNCQYLYQDNNGNCICQDEDYREVHIPFQKSKKIRKYLKNGDNFKIILCDNQFVSVLLPQHVPLKVIETTTNLKNSSINNDFKQAILETKISITVPNFIKIGDEILINTNTGKYYSRK